MFWWRWIIIISLLFFSYILVWISWLIIWCDFLWFFRCIILVLYFFNWFIFNIASNIIWKSFRNNILWLYLNSICSRWIILLSNLYILWFKIFRHNIFHLWWLIIIWICLLIISIVYRCIFRNSSARRNRRFLLLFLNSVWILIMSFAVIFC